MKSANKKGYVYILSNPTMPGIVKIGKTMRAPEVRLKELNSATGVAMPFRIEAVIETNNPSITERIIHQNLSNNRINKRREFFKVSIKEANAVAKNAAKRTKGRIYSGRRKTRSNSTRVAQLVAIFAMFTWTSVFNQTVSIAITGLCIWSMLTRKPKILWEFLTFPSIFGKYSIAVFFVLSLYPIAAGKLDINIITLQLLLNDLQKFISIGTRL